MAVQLLYFGLICFFHSSLSCLDPLLSSLSLSSLWQVYLSSLITPFSHVGKQAGLGGLYRSVVFLGQCEVKETDPG